ncbi:MAG TPA: 16S rRNA (guanine(527)-N(7))-methyltransferase RsmG [Terriglobales bacterium]|jgi:16S rRNA (guanine527-N7)-methyltransferase|nr:16S rRNA (guanine(527)-N(7))-methyltransferase RsmG [Terriglobales bacterium]
MDIASLLAPFLPSPGLSPAQLEQVQTYLDLLLRWNQKINLTSVRKPEDIVTRHFGESFFLAASLWQTGVAATNVLGTHFIDLGSGAGFPGVPLKIYEPEFHGTLMESQNKKATFLKEVIRALKLTEIDVFNGRAEQWLEGSPTRANLVTLRAVERFEQVLPVAAELSGPKGRLALLIGSAQVETAHTLLPSFKWEAPCPVPQSHSRMLLMGHPRQ